jgi:hypothetical protein
LHSLSKQGGESLTHLLEIGGLPAVPTTGNANGAVSANSVTDQITHKLPLCI